MAKKDASVRVSLFLLVLGLLAAGSAFAGSLIVGSVAGATHASLGGQALVAGNTIFSGDDLEVRDGAAVVTVGSGSRMVFGKDSVASFGRDASEVTAFLSKGSASVYHPAEDQALLRLRIGNLSIVPGKGFKTLGEVAMTGDTLIVTAGPVGQVHRQSIAVPAAGGWSTNLRRRRLKRGDVDCGRGWRNGCGFGGPGHVQGKRRQGRFECGDCGCQ